MTRRTSWLYFAFGVLIAVALGALPGSAADWPPIPLAEMNLKDSPAHPGAHGVVLYREEYTDDTDSFSRFHVRIKILTEEGKKFANVELPFLKELYRIHDLKARTVRPDGTWVEFDGEVFEKTVAKGTGYKFLAKTFSLPEVQVGSIIEYKYREQWDVSRFPNRRWNVQMEIPTLRAVFSRKPYSQFALRWISYRLPNQETAKEEKGGLIRLVLENIPPSVEEEYMPPKNEVNMRVDFFYIRRAQTQEEYWKDVGQTRHRWVEDFVGKHGDVQRLVQELLKPDDSPETKLRKLYTRAQQVHNLSFERSKTEKEEKREKRKDNNNVKDVLKSGYGYAWEINCLFVAMARAAGFDAAVAYLSGRNEYFFVSQVLDDDQLNSFVTVVRLESQNLFLDPAARFAPYGLLFWSDTGVTGLLLNKDGGTFIQSPNLTNADALTERIAKLELLDDGTLKGTLVVNFHGQEAYKRRRDAYDEDDAGRRKEIEDEIKGWLSASATLEIASIQPWDDNTQPLRVECNLTIPNFAASTGRRLLMPIAPFHIGGSHPFQHAKRVHPVYLQHPFQEFDDVTLTLPEGFRVETVPRARQDGTSFAALETGIQQQGGALRLQRRLRLEGYLFRLEYYPQLRSFFDRVRSADEERLVLQAQRN